MSADGVRDHLGRPIRVALLEPTGNRLFHVEAHAFALEANFDLARFHSNEFELEWPPRSGTMQRFPEIDRIAWFDLPTARKKILPGQRGFLDELERQLRE